MDIRFDCGGAFRIHFFLPLLCFGSLAACSSGNSEAPKPSLPPVEFNYQGNNTPVAISQNNANDLAIAAETFSVVAWSLTELLSDQVDLFAEDFLRDIGIHDSVPPPLSRPSTINVFFSLPTECLSGERETHQMDGAHSTTYSSCEGSAGKIVNGTVSVKHPLSDVYSIQSTDLEISTESDTVTIRADLNVNVELLKDGLNYETIPSATGNLQVSSSRHGIDLYLTNGIFDLTDSLGNSGRLLTYHLFGGTMYHSTLGSINVQPSKYIYDATLSNNEPIEIWFATFYIGGGRIIAYRDSSKVTDLSSYIAVGATLIDLPQSNLAPEISRINYTLASEERKEFSLHVVLRDEPGELLTASWRLVSAPVGSRSTHACERQRCTNLLFYPDMPGNYRFEVTAFDGDQQSAPTTYDAVVEPVLFETSLP